MTTPRVILFGLILATVLCWLMASRAHADECVTMDNIAEYILSSAPHATVKRLHGPDAKKILDGYNSAGNANKFRSRRHHYSSRRWPRHGADYHVQERLRV